MSLERPVKSVNAVDATGSDRQHPSKTMQTNGDDKRTGMIGNRSVDERKYTPARRLRCESLSLEGEDWRVPAIHRAGMKTISSCRSSSSDTRNPALDSVAFRSNCSPTIFGRRRLRHFDREGIGFRTVRRSTARLARLRCLRARSRTHKWQSSVGNTRLLCGRKDDAERPGQKVERLVRVVSGRATLRLTKSRSARMFFFF